MSNVSKSLELLHQALKQLKPTGTVLPDRVQGSSGASAPSINENYVVVPKPNATPPSSSLSTDESKSDTKSAAPDPTVPPVGSQQTALIKLSRELFESRAGSDYTKPKRFQKSLAGTCVHLYNAVPVGLADDIVNGTAYYNRVGYQIRIHHIKLRCQFDWYNATSSTSNVQPLINRPVRLIVGLDKMGFVSSVSSYGMTLADDTSGQTSQNFTAVLHTDGQGNYSNIAANYNVNTHGYRYDILLDEVIQPHTFQQSITVTGAIVTSFGSTFREWHIPVHRNVLNIDPAGTLTDQVNRPFAYFIDSSGQSSPVSINASWEITFDDTQF